MRAVGGEGLSWFWERKLRVEHALYITRGKFYGIGWSRTGWRSRYRTVGSTPVPPWKDRSTRERSANDQR